MTQSPPSLLWINLCQLTGLGASRMATLRPLFDRQGQLETDGIDAVLGDFPPALAKRVARCLAQGGQDLLHREAEQLAEWMQDPAHSLLASYQDHYPPLLQLIDDPPPLLFGRGNIDMLLQPQLAMVGTRSPTKTGMETARRFARALAEGGFTITSGLATGIDGCAHEGALDTLGGTIAVMGAGIDVIYPTAHRKLAERIAESGLLISELAPGCPPVAQNFPRRNRIISGLTLGTIVVEASVRSGSLITARLALEQHREVFAIPGSIHNPQARGCHHLIKQGARLIESTGDIMDELPSLMALYQQQSGYPQQSGYQGRSGHPGAAETADSQHSESVPESAVAALEDTEAQRVLEVIGYDLMPADELVALTGLSIAQVQQHLMSLELSGLICTERGGVMRTR